jgi:hypothetical protein
MIAVGPSPVPSPTLTVYIPSPVPIPIPVPQHKTGIDWGNAPQWVSAVFAVASVLAAGYIILRDRRKVEREQIAMLVVMTQRGSWKRDGYSHHITLINSSSQVFYDVGATVYFDINEEPKRKQLIPTEGRLLKRRAYLAKVKHVIRKGGGRDDWAFKLNDDELADRKLAPQGEVYLRIPLPGYGHPGYIIIHCKDAAGRYWAIDAASKIIFRFDSFEGGLENWG